MRPATRMTSYDGITARRYNRRLAIGGKRHSAGYSDGTGGQAAGAF